MTLRALLAWLFIAPVAFADEPPLRRIAFGSCASQEKPQPIWDAVIATQPQLFLFLGDVIYADTDNPEIMQKKYAQLGAVPGFVKLRETCPIQAIWDDHDYGTDDAGGDYPMKVQSQKLFLTFFNEPADSPRWKQKGIYTAKIYGPPGKRVQVILLDTRYNRTPLKKEGKTYIADADEKATFLGEEQWAWLAEQLKQPAEVRLLCSSIQIVAQDHPYEKWANIPRERERLFKLLKDSKAEGTIVLSGDRHLAELSVGDAGLGYPLFDVTSSGLNQAARNWRMPEKNANRIASMTHGDNFGSILIDWDKPTPDVRMQIRDVAGEVVIQQRINANVLKPKEQRTVSATPAAPVGAGAVSPTDAAKQVGQMLTVEMKVKSTGVTTNKSRTFLNSMEARDPANFTIVIDMKKAADSLTAAGITDPKDHYKGKTIRVTGTVATFRDSPQIVVEDVKQIVVVP